MPRVRRRGKVRVTDIDGDQYIELSHLSPPSFTDDRAFSPSLPEWLRSTFASPFLRRAAWEHYKDELMQDCPPGRRPGGFWWYSAPERPREDESQADCLRRLGLLQAWEVAELAAIESIKQGGDE
jgi:hypothetical protein